MDAMRQSPFLTASIGLSVSAAVPSRETYLIRAQIIIDLASVYIARHLQHYALSERIDPNCSYIHIAEASCNDGKKHKSPSGVTLIKPALIWHGGSIYPQPSPLAALTFGITARVLGLAS